jgi:hypothetical protein
MPEQGFIGNADMDEQGVIHLDLRAVFPNGDVGLSRFKYHPTHPKYAEILAHLGGLKPGEIKGVPPWPDDQGEE